MSLLSWVKREPAVLITLASAGVAAGAVIGLHLNPTETKEVYSVAATVAALLVRRTVSPTSASGMTLAALEARLAAIEPIVNALVPASLQPEVQVVEAALAAEIPQVPSDAAGPVGIARTTTSKPLETTEVRYRLM